MVLQEIGNYAAGGAKRGRCEGVVLRDELQQGNEALSGFGEICVDAVDQQLRVIAEGESGNMGKDDLAFELLTKGELLPTQFELTEQAVEWCLFITGRGIIGDGMQPGFEEVLVPVKVGIEATKAGMFFEEKDFWKEARGSNGGGQSGKAAANDQQRNFHEIIRPAIVAEDRRRNC